MYAWIWRKLPFGLPGKLIGSVLLASVAVALFWYVIFPWAEPLLPFDDVQVTDDSGILGDPAGDDPAGGGGAGPDLDDHDLPYDTEPSDPTPSETGNR